MELTFHLQSPRCHWSLYQTGVGGLQSRPRGRRDGRNGFGPAVWLGPWLDYCTCPKSMQQSQLPPPDNVAQFVLEFSCLPAGNFVFFFSTPPPSNIQHPTSQFGFQFSALGSVFSFQFSVRFWVSVLVSLFNLKCKSSVKNKICSESVAIAICSLRFLTFLAPRLCIDLFWLLINLASAVPRTLSLW